LKIILLKSEFSSFLTILCKFDQIWSKNASRKRKWAVSITPIEFFCVGWNNISNNLK
jgi:hypothetical protein